MDEIRIGQAAELLGVSVDTVRRWATDGRVTLRRSPGGQRLLPLQEVARLLGERRAARPGATKAASARNRFEGVVTAVEADRVAAVVEVMAGPHRFVSLMTAEAARDLDLAPGRRVVCSVKATNVVVEIPE